MKVRTLFPWKFILISGRFSFLASVSRQLPLYANLFRSRRNNLASLLLKNTAGGILVGWAQRSR